MSNEKPIIFNDQMVRAILEGRKTQTRRIAKPPKGFDWVDESLGTVANKNDGMWPVYELEEVSKPFGQVGDYLWVREAWRQFDNSNECGCSEYPCPCPNNGHVIFRSTHDDGESKWKPSIHMPRWAARIKLEIKKIRVERLQDISEADAIAEGVKELRKGYWRNYNHEWTQFQLSAKSSFTSLWKALYGEESWNENPWVHVIEFERVTDEKAQ